MSVVPEVIRYGKRNGFLVDKYKDPRAANAKAAQLRKMNIVVVIRPWYSWWCVYRCGVKKSGRAS